VSNPQEEGEDIITKRAEICDRCDKKQFIICGECGCVIWAKIRLKKEKCPLGKW
jgi:hypothetical protein